MYFCSEIIKEALNSPNLEIQEVDQISKMASRNPTPMFLIHLVNNEKSKEMFVIRDLYHFLVNIEPYTMAALKSNQMF